MRRPLGLSAVSQSLGRTPALFAFALEEEKAEEDKVGGWGKSGWKRGGKARNGQKKIVNIRAIVAAQRCWKRFEVGAKVSWHFDCTSDGSQSESCFCRDKMFEFLKCRRSKNSR